MHRVLAVVTDETVPLHHALGTAQWLLSPSTTQEPSTESSQRVSALLARRGSSHPRVRTAAYSPLLSIDSIAWMFPAPRRPRPVRQGDSSIRAQRGRTDHGRDRPRDRDRAPLVVGTLHYEPLLTTMRRSARVRIRVVGQRRIGDVTSNVVRWCCAS